jgi:hypothetical protein
VKRGYRGGRERARESERRASLAGTGSLNRCRAQSSALIVVLLVLRTVEEAMTSAPRG